MARLRELLRCDPDHLFPPWHPRRGERGAPRVFFTPAVADLVAELRSAPLQPLDKRDGGEIVDPQWESRSGHSAAMARYAVMSRPESSIAVVAAPEDPRRRAVWEQERVERRDAGEVGDSIEDLEAAAGF